jgi:hypothetical protein
MLLLLYWNAGIVFGFHKTGTFLTLPFFPHQAFTLVVSLLVVK